LCGCCCFSASCSDGVLKIADAPGKSEPDVGSSAPLSLGWIAPIGTGAVDDGRRRRELPRVSIPLGPPSVLKNPSKSNDGARDGSGAIGSVFLRGTGGGAIKPVAASVGAVASPGELLSYFLLNEFLQGRR